MDPILTKAVFAYLNTCYTVAAVLAQQEERKKQQVEEQRALEQQHQDGPGPVRRRTRSVWVQRWIQRRQLHGHYNQLLHELNAEYRRGYRNYLRMDSDTFQGLLTRIAPRITKEDTNYRKALEPGLKLAVTLRYMATGDSYKSLGYNFRVGFSTICTFVPQVCRAIMEELSDEVIACPTTAEGWNEIATTFRNRWNFPHCLGAIDGKHIAIRNPKKSGSFYYNYKKFFSIVLLAVVDPDYKFIYVDIGHTGCGSDAGIFASTPLKEALEDGSLNMPDPDPLPNDDQPMPYFFVGDDAFALKTWMMKPLPLRNMTHEQRVFNYRLSRARRVVENAFGILAARFRCLLTTMPQTPDRVTIITHACCVLHNYLRLRKPALDVTAVDQEDPDTHEIIPGTWRENAHLPDMELVYRGNTTRAAKEQRNYLVQYVNSDAGRVSWQNDIVSVN